MMKKIGIIIFDQFTDIDLFLLWDILGREKALWEVKILGTKAQHISTNGLSVTVHGNIQEANKIDVVLFSSGKGTREVIKNTVFLNSFLLNPSKQIIGSICSGALILASLGLLKGKKATTHPRAKSQLQQMEVETIDKPLVVNQNIATAGGCLSGLYLAWLLGLLKK